MVLKEMNLVFFVRKLVFYLNFPKSLGGRVASAVAPEAGKRGYPSPSCVLAVTLLPMALGDPLWIRAGWVWHTAPRGVPEWDPGHLARTLALVFPFGILACRICSSYAAKYLPLGPLSARASPKVCGQLCPCFLFA